jgi:hypothetical protein
MWGKRSNHVLDQYHRVLRLIVLLSAVLTLFFLPPALSAARIFCGIMIISTVFDTVFVPNEQPHFSEIEQHASSPRRENQKHEQQDSAQGCSPAQDQKAITSQHDYFEHVEGSPQIFTGPVYIQQGSLKPRAGERTKTDENTQARTKI